MYKYIIDLNNMLKLKQIQINNQINFFHVFLIFFNNICFCVYSYMIIFRIFIYTYVYN